MPQPTNAATEHDAFIPSALQQALAAQEPVILPVSRAETFQAGLERLATEVRTGVITAVSTEK